MVLKGAEPHLRSLSYHRTCRGTCTWCPRAPAAIQSLHVLPGVRLTPLSEFQDEFFFFKPKCFCGYFNEIPRQWVELDRQAPFMALKQSMPPVQQWPLYLKLLLTFGLRARGEAIPSRPIGPCVPSTTRGSYLQHRGSEQPRNTEPFCAPCTPKAFRGPLEITPPG